MSSERDKALDVARAAYDRTYRPEGFTKVRELSDRRSKVYRDDETGNVYVGFRGTQVSRPSDLLADAHILAGTQKYSSRFQEASEKLKRTKKAFPDARIITSGHSLGSSQSTWLGRNESGVDAAYGFNTGSHPKHVAYDSLREHFWGPRTDTKIHEESTGYDPISLGLHIPRANTSRVRVVGGFDPHTLGNFV